jgi:histidine triad (HIT) family protein
MADECIFCQIVEGEIPFDKVYEDDEFFAFRDIDPGAPVHVLLIPKKHIPRITDIVIDEASLIGRMFIAANNIAWQEGIAESGFRYVFNCNQHGGQAVYHIHLHILGGRQLAWPPG